MKLFQRLREWLRSRVTALRDTRGVYVNVNDDDDYLRDVSVFSNTNHTNCTNARIATLACACRMEMTLL